MFLAAPARAQINVIVPPSGTLTVQGDLGATQYQNPNLFGTTTADTLNANAFSYLAVNPVPYNAGTISDSGTLALVPTNTQYALTNAGSYLISVPTNLPAGYYIIDGVSASTVDPALITFSNAAVRPAAANNQTITNILIQTGSQVLYSIGLFVTNFTGTSGAIKYIDATGDVFAQAIAANQVSLTPPGTMVSTDVQAGIAELSSKKATLTNLATVATSGAYSDLSGAPPSLDLASVYASGSAYTLTATPAALDFGTTDPVMPISIPGNYILTGFVTLNYNGATFAANRTVTLKLRRTNNTAADIANSTITLTTDITTTKTETFIRAALPPVGYTTANNNDSITIFADVSATPSAGSLQAVAASIQRWPVNTWAVLDASAPTVTGAGIDSAGTTLSITNSENVVFGAGGSGGFVLNASGGNPTLSSPAIVNNVITYTSSRTIATNETLTLDYTQPGNGVEDLSGNDLASFTGTNVVNNSSSTGFVPLVGTFDGSNDYMTTSTSGTGWFDSKIFTASFWINLHGGDAVNQDIIVNGTTDRFRIRRNSSNKISIRGASLGGTLIYDISGSTSLTSASGWKHVMIGMNTGATNQIFIKIDGVDETLSYGQATSNTSIDLSNTNLRVGAGIGGASKCNADLSEVWLVSGTLVSDVTKFSSGGCPISLGSNGELPFGSPPSFYYTLFAWSTNPVLDSSGNGNNASVTGSIGSAASPPCP